MNSQVEKAASNAWLMLLGRGAMVFTLPVIGFFGAALWNQVGDLAKGQRNLEISNQGVASDLRVLKAEISGQLTGVTRASDLAIRDVEIRTLRDLIAEINIRIANHVHRLETLEAKKH